MLLISKNIRIKNGGEGEIRTLEGLTPLPVFKTGAFNRSATSPILCRASRCLIIVYNYGIRVPAQIQVGIVAEIDDNCSGTKDEYRIEIMVNNI